MIFSGQKEASHTSFGQLVMSLPIDMFPTISDPLPSFLSEQIQGDWAESSRSTLLDR